MQSDDDREAIGKLLLEALEKRRGLHDFFDWPERSVKEREIARQTLESCGISYSELSSRGKADPPDCEAIIEGQRTGIELTEIVDQESIENFKQTCNPYAWCDWSEEKFRELLSRCIAKKDNPTDLKGGPYVRYMLILYSDEPGLSQDVVSQYLQHFSVSAQLIDKAIILLSYDPKTNNYPALNIPLTK